MTTPTLIGQAVGQIISLSAVVVGVALAAVVALNAMGGGKGPGSGNGGVAAPPATERPSAPAEPTPVDAGGTHAEPQAERTTAPTRCRSGSTSRPSRAAMSTSISSMRPASSSAPSPGRLPKANRSGSTSSRSRISTTTTLRLKWVDYPIENALALYISEHDGGLRLLLIQPAPTGPTDSIALDRELILSFSQPISADDVESFLQEGLDTPG